MKAKGTLFGGSYKDSAKIGMLLLLFTVSLAAPGDRQPLGTTSGGDDAFSSLVSSVFEAFEGGLSQHVTPFYQKARADPLLSKILFVFFALFLVKVFLFDFVSCLFCGCRKKAATGSGLIDKDVIEKLRVIDASFKEFKTELEALKKVQIPTGGAASTDAAGKGQPASAKKETAKPSANPETQKAIEVLETKVNEAVSYLTQFKEYNQRYQKVISESQKDVWVQINEIKSKLASRGTRGKSARSTSMPRDLLRSNGTGNDPDESLISNNTIKRDDDESREEKSEIKEQTPPKAKLPAQLVKKPVGPPITNKPGQPFRPSQAVEAQRAAEEGAKVPVSNEPKPTGPPFSASKIATSPTTDSNPGPVSGLPRPGPPTSGRPLAKPNAFAKRPPVATPGPVLAQESVDEPEPVQTETQPIQADHPRENEDAEFDPTVSQSTPQQESAQETTGQVTNPDPTSEELPLGEDDESKPKTGFGAAPPKPVFRPPNRPAGPPGARPGGVPPRPAGPPPRAGGAPLPRKPPA